MSLAPSLHSGWHHLGGKERGEKLIETLALRAGARGKKGKGEKRGINIRTRNRDPWISSSFVVTNGEGNIIHASLPLLLRQGSCHKTSRERGKGREEGHKNIPLRSMAQMTARRSMFYEAASEGGRGTNERRLFLLQKVLLFPPFTCSS